MNIAAGFNKLQSQSIIFIDQNYVAVNKPEGLLVHPSFIDKDEKECAMKQLRDLLDQWVYPIHRLDRPTSGILIFGRNSEAAARLVEEFSSRKVEKRYLALVRGFTDPEGIIDRPLKQIWDKMTDKHASPNKPAQEAITRYRTVARVELPVPIAPHPTSRYSLVMAKPETGRQRQIRRHFKSIFHPIIGDPKHGDGNHNRMFRQQFGLERLLLHAFTLSFVHPYTHENIEICAPLPSSFSEVLKKIGISTDFVENQD